MAVMERMISRSGQLAIPRELLRTLKLTPPVKVAVTRRNGTIVITPSKQRKLSDEEFLALLERLWKRSPRLTQRRIQRIVQRAR